MPKIADKRYMYIYEMLTLSDIQYDDIPGINIRVLYYDANAVLFSRKRQLFFFFMLFPSMRRQRQLCFHQ